MKPFKFKLEKISTKQKRLIDAAYSFLPALGGEKIMERVVLDTAERLLNDDVQIELEAAYYEGVDVFEEKLPEDAIIAVFGLSPLKSKALCEIDPILAAVIVDRLLGGSVESPQVKKLTDTEFGILQYLLLQIMSATYEAFDGNSKLHYRFDKFLNENSRPSSIIGQNVKLANLIYRIKIGTFSGFVRLALPEPFMEEAFLSNLKSHKNANYDDQVERMSEYGFVSVPLWAEIGRASFTVEELSNVEKGDVIVFDESEIVLRDNIPSGEVVLRVGDGLGGGIAADIEADKYSVKCKIKSFRQ